MNESELNVPQLRVRGEKPIPRDVSDDIMEVLNVNLTNAIFDEESSPATGASFDALIFNNRVGNVTPVFGGGLSRGLRVGNTITQRTYAAAVGDIYIAISGPGGVIDSGASEKDIEGDLKDLLTVHLATITPLVADGTKLRSDIIVKPRGAKFGSSQIDRSNQQYGGKATVPSANLEEKFKRKRI